MRRGGERVEGWDWGCGVRSRDVGGKAMHWGGIICMCFID